MDFDRIKNIEKAHDLLKNYNGNNPYLIGLKNGVFVYKNTTLNQFQIDYIIQNADFEPKLINKIVKIADWYGNKKKEDWNTEFVPQKIKLGYLVGVTNDFYHVYVQYRQSQEKQLLQFIPKSAILTDFLSENWNDVIVDFDKYNKKSGLTIKPHQERGIKFLLSRKKSILSLEQGLGKTMVSIVAALEGGYEKILVICPASLKTNWKSEIARFENEDNITIVDGSTWNDSKFTIINYDILKNFYTVAKEVKNIKVKEFTDDGKIQWKTSKKEVKTNKKDLVDKALSTSQLFTSKFDLIIIDEAHRLSNKTSGMYEIVEDLMKRSNPKGVFELTGTIIRNNPTNLYNILKIIGAEVTKDWVGYMTRYCGAKQIIKNRKERDYYTNNFLKTKNKSSWYDLTYQEKQELNEYLGKVCKKIWIMGEPSNLDELNERIKHLYYRETNNFDAMGINKETKLIEYTLNSEQKHIYDNAWKEFLSTHEETDIDKLIQNHKLIEGSVFRQVLADFMVENTIKLAEEEISKGKKIIIFCCFDKELYSLQEYFGERCTIYNGKMTAKKKDESLKSFKENNNIKVFIGNIQAASVGLNINEASVVIFQNASFVPSDNVQGEFRCLRIGQDKDVTVYYQKFVNTFQDRLFEILEIKNNISNVIINDENY